MLRAGGGAGVVPGAPAAMAALPPALELLCPRAEHALASGCGRGAAGYPGSAPKPPLAPRDPSQEPDPPPMALGWEGAALWDQFGDFVTGL